MNRVTIVAADVVLYVRRTKEVGVFLARFMAAQAAFRCLLRRQTGETDNLAGIRRFSVFLDGAVASFTTLPLRSLVLGESGFPVGTFVIALGDVLMAGLTRVSPHILRWIG